MVSWACNPHHVPIPATSNQHSLISAIGSAKSVKLGLASSPDASSAWFKTVVDPAHAREYGCRGIPDENHEPSLVLQFRKTDMLRSGTIGGTNSSGSGVEISKITEVYVIQVFGLVSTNVITVIRGTNEGGDEGMSVRSVDVSNSAWKDVKWPQARAISNSLTVDWIGTELNRGGFFEAAYLPMSYVDTTPRGASGYYSYGIDLSSFGTYTSYTASSDAGVYVVGAINSYDQYKWWRSGQASYNTVLNITGPSGGVWPISVPVGGDMSLDPFGMGTRVSVVRYIPPSDTSEFVIRYTANAAVEVTASPARGGSDGASYDPAAIEMYRTLADQMVLIFPASYNDLGTLWTSLKNLIPKIPTVMKALTGFIPGAKQAKEIFRLWLEGVPIVDSVTGVMGSMRQAKGKTPPLKNLRRQFWEPQRA